MIEAECKKISVTRNTDVVIAYELACPYCKSPIVVEEDLAKCFSNIFCLYCKQKITLKI